VVNGQDPFSKVKGLIRDMVERLESEAASEANKKAFCDKEMGETKTKKAELETAINDLSVKMEKMNADIATLKDEVATLQAELRDLAKSEVEMDKMRVKEHEEYVVAKQELEEGLDGIQMALKVLRDYYATKGDGEDAAATGSHEKASGAASGIIGMLEVAESDFTKNLADTETEEQNAQDEYDNIKKENEITRATKGKDIEYKTKEYKGLEKAAEEASSDLEGLETEHAAVNEYWEKIKEECIAKPETYEERKRRREAEIAGLKEALSILEGEAVLLQKSSMTVRRNGLRGIAKHA